MRKAGILLPLSSLPSPYGIGTLGHAAFNFIDFLAQSGQSLWQILPIGPTGYGDSPYQSFSAFAGNPYNIDLDLLCGDGLLEKADIGEGWGGDATQTDYGLLYEKRFKVLAKAAARQDKASPKYRAFCDENSFWLDDYALFMALKEANGGKGFIHWPAPVRMRHPLALKAARAQYAPRIEFWRCLQYFFFTQWAALKAYAKSQGVGIVGDIPIYVSDDSSDLWAFPELFQVDENGLPREVAGVPPDAFSADGQLWGNPLYNWAAHKRTRYAWWLARLRQCSQLFDYTRIDHFRGFAGYYAIPAGDTTARDGVWRKGPGSDFIRTVKRALPRMNIIAEDLGFLTQEVHDLLEYSGYPGMKVLQFAFDSREESDYLPHNYLRHTVVYTGTHDNTTTEAWAADICEEDAQFARRYIGLTDTDSMAEGMIRAAMTSVAELAIIPMQDWLHLGKNARFNTPSTLGGGNWCWRLLPGQLTADIAAHIRLFTRVWGRLSDVERQKEAYARDIARKMAGYAPPLEPAAVSKAAEKQQSMQPPTESELAAESLPENQLWQDAAPAPEAAAATKNPVKKAAPRARKSAAKNTVKNPPKNTK